MDNLVDSNSIQIPSTSSIQSNCILMNDNADAETIVSSTEHTTIESIDGPDSAVKNNYATDVKSLLQETTTTTTGEYRNSAQSHVAIVTASASTNQNKCVTNESQQSNSNGREKSKTTSDKGWHTD